MKRNGVKGALAYSYLRFSSPEQSKGDSIRRQTELRDQWLQRHGITLDTTLTLRDEGTSGFTGKHRENPDRHALATFLELVRARRIPHGSYLIVESLDRLTREDIRPALTLLLNLIDSGVRIVQLLPSEAIYDEDVESMALMMAIMELSRGHSESRMKSERVGRAWSAKRQRAMRDREILTRRIPGWLRVQNGSFVVNERAAETVRRIYAMAADGYGLGQITKRLNRDKVPTIGRASYWARSYVAKILATRAVLGEYQPHTIANGQKRRATGDPIQSYYPAIISQEDWYAARAGLANRRNKPGRISAGGINLFANLLHDARDGGTLIQMNKGRKGTGKILASYRAHQGLQGASSVSFPFVAFERAILSKLREIDVRAVLPRENPAEHAVSALTGRLAWIEGRLAKIAAALLENGDIGELAIAAKNLEQEQVTIRKSLDQARQASLNPLTRAWANCQSLIDLIEKAPDQEDIRLRLRAAIRAIVSEIWCLFVTRGSKRIALVQVWFQDQRYHRDYLIVHTPRRGGFLSATDAQTVARSMRYEGPVDLRDRQNVETVERFVERQI